MLGPAPSPEPIRGRSLEPDPAKRRRLAARLARRTADLTTATLAEIDRRHSWFGQMPAEHRSWVTLVARAGIDHFVTWVADEAGEPAEPVELFTAAPRQATRRINLHQTVELVKTTIDVVEHELARLEPGDRDLLGTALVHFSRSVAFAAAEVYARAAEQRGDWDTRLEAFVLDSVVRGEADDDLVSRASALGWSASGGVAVAVGPLPENPPLMLDRLHSRAAEARLGVLASPQTDRLVAVLGGEALTDQTAALGAFAGMAESFGPGPLVVGPVVADLAHAHLSARPAVAGWRAAVMRPDAPRPVAADDLLAERFLLGDETAGPGLIRRAVEPLLGPDVLLATLTAYLDEGSSVEASARRLFVHSNTVRYRLRRIAALTGLEPHLPQDAFTLGLAVRLARLPHESR